jgi:hypothetical protein
MDARIIDDGKKDDKKRNFENPDGIGSQYRRSGFRRVRYAA